MFSKISSQLLFFLLILIINSFWVSTVSLNPRSLITAMEAGEFYASTGVELKELILKNNELSIKVKKNGGKISNFIHWV
jgi:hypothetical protein